MQPPKRWLFLFVTITYCFSYHSPCIPSVFPLYISPNILFASEYQLINFYLMGKIRGHLRKDKKGITFAPELRTKGYKHNFNSFLIWEFLIKKW